MTTKREKEESELRVPVVAVCTPPQPMLMIKSSCLDSRTTSPVVKPDLGLLKKRPREVTRCSGSGCKKRVGLMGFRCRCGDVFCSDHRYSDRHHCTYDYKAAGRDAIAKDNPLVRATKLLKV